MMQDFEEKGIHFVKFGAAWCQPCKALEPSLNKFEEEHISKVKVHRVDIDAAFDMASKYNIRNIPTIVIFKDGEPIDRLHGVQSLQNLKTKLEYVESN